MKAFTIFLAIAFLALSVNAWRFTVNEKDCRDDEQYSSCTPTELSCAHPNPPPMIPTVCNQGCFCKAGLVREDGRDGKCVKVEECPITII